MTTTGYRRRMRLAAMAVSICLSTAGCAGDPSAQDVLAGTASKLRDLRSGRLDLRLVVTPAGKGADGDIGFELKGPFGLGKPGALPVGELAYTQIAGPRRGSATLISTGREAFVKVGERVYELPPRQQRELRGAAAALDEQRGLAALYVGDWVRRPKLSGGGTVGGVEADRVSAELDVVAALNDLASLSRGLHGERTDGSATLEGVSARQVERAVRSSRLELLSGKDDRLLRRLVMEVDFGLDVPEVLRSDLGRLAGGRLSFELRVDDPNRPVAVPEPRGAEPYPDD